MIDRPETVRLGTIAAIQRSAVTPQDLAVGTLYVGLEHIDSNGAFDGVSAITGGEITSTKFSFGPAHVLFSKLRPYLRKIARPSFSGVCSTEILPILPGPRVDRDYLFHYLRQDRLVRLASSLSAGVNLPRLSPILLNSFEILLPALSAQRRIAAILDQADSLRAKRRAALTKLDGLSLSLFLEIFGRPEENPFGWPMAALGESISYGPQNGLYKPSNRYGHGVPILRIDSFYDGSVRRLDQLKRVNISDGERTLFGLKPNDIVVNRVNSLSHLGKSAIVPPLPEETVFESNMMRFRVNPDKLNPDFLITFLQLPFVKRQILGMAKDAVNQSSINQQDVKGLQILLPPLGLQSKFANAITRIEVMKTLLRDSSSHLDRLFDSLQHRTFRGEL